MEVSRNAVAGRRLYLQHITTLLDFSRPGEADKVTAEQGICGIAVEPLAPDIVSEGTHCLRLLAGEESEGLACHTLCFTCRLEQAVDLRKTPTLTFTFSAYDGARDSQYFKNVKENMYFVERPDPQLISHSFLTVSLLGGGRTCDRTVQLTDYGFNRLFFNFSGEDILPSVEAIRFTYVIQEAAPGWQRVIKLDTVKAGMEVDFTLKGSGMEALFSGVNASLAHRDGVLTCVCGAGAQILFPDLTDGADTLCDVFLPVKNTLLLRMEADVPDLSLTVAFRTEADSDFTEENRKTFPLSGLTEPRTLFLNLSDCPGTQGKLGDPRRLTGLALCPDRPCTLRLYKISFEQEDPIRPTAGRFLSCTADPATDRIRLVCALDPALCGSELSVYDGFLDVIDEDEETLSALERVAVGTVPGDGHLTLTAPLHRGKVTRVCSQFIGAVRTPAGELLPLDGRATVQNWQAVCPEGNPYAFDLPEVDYVVTDPAFGAVGDGYTDDTGAIQAALDAAALTGGRVVLPGGDTPACTPGYGRRYVVSNLRLPSRVELHIGEGAILWQSDDMSHYRILPRFGHNVSMTGVNWPANHSSGNYPLLYAFREDCVKVTGPGTIRMCDTESRSRDGHFRFIGDNVCIGCCDRMHTIPLGLVECRQVEVRDLTILRSSAPFMILNSLQQAYIANVVMDQAKCTGADGMWPCGSDGVRMTRIMMNNNDDGLCLSANYNDPRDMLWNFSYPGWDHGTHHLELSHARFSCYTFTASAISFCVWGTDAPDLSRAEVNDIHIFDTVLEGRLSIGGWLDNPYYGVFPFDCSETDDFSPIKNLHIHDCELRSPLGIQLLRITNFDNDLGCHSPSDFEYGDFNRRPAERNPGWVTGLSNWSYADRSTVEQVALYGENCATLRPCRGKDCDLWQGLFLTAGAHTMTFRYKAGGSFTAFVRDTQGRDIASADLTQAPGGYFKGRDWQSASLSFTAPADGLYRLGVAADPARTVAVYVTGFRMDQPETAATE